MNCVKDISETLKGVYSFIYSDNEYLIKLNNHIINTIKNEYGDSNVTYNEELEQLTVIKSDKVLNFYIPNIKYILNLKLPSEIEKFKEIKTNESKWTYLIQ